MFDTGEYLLNLEEQAKACQGMADSTRQYIQTVKHGEIKTGDMLSSLFKLYEYRQAYNALIEHAEALWNTM